MHATRAGVSCFAASAALLVVGAPAAAAPKPITGTLSKPGYTVIALAANGKAKAVRARRGKFRLVPPAAVVTLHLRTPRGIYAGPVLVSRDRSGTRVILGVKAGARLSRVAVGRGYASLKARLARKSVDRTRWARARKGVPIGNGRNFGRVRSKPPRARPPGDRDADGVPDVLDIDDDGDLILDDLDRSTAARATQALDNPLLTSSMTGGPSGTPNANIPGADDAQIDAAFSGGASTLLIGIPSGGSTELDCGDPDTGLVYCRKNGSTGTVFQGNVPPSAQPRFPSCCDPDNDGFGALVPPSNLPPNSGAGAMSLVHGARTDQIKTGDQLIKRVNDANGGEIGTFTATLQYLFVTIPALFSYDDDGPGGRAPTVLSYPYSPAVAHEFPVSPRPAGDPFAGDVVVTLTFWRPQRRRIVGDPAPLAGDSATWTDIGGLSYGVSLGPTGGAAFAGGCPLGAFSEDDPNLVPVSAGGFIGFTDSRQPADQPANAANKLTFTVDLTRCDAPAWNAGETRFLELLGTSPNGHGVAQQALIFKRQ